VIVKDFPTRSLMDFADMLKFTGEFASDFPSARILETARSTVSERAEADAGSRAPGRFKLESGVFSGRGGGVRPTPLPEKDALVVGALVLLAG
jgi:hypothetical protein